MRVFVAILCALAICVGQYFTGSGMRPVLAFPGYVILALAGLLSLPRIWNRSFVLPRWECCLFAGGFILWLLLRQSAPDGTWMAGGFFRLTLACAVMYLVVGGAMNTPGSRVIFLSILMVDGVIQAAIGFAQFGGLLGRCPQGWVSEFHRMYLDTPLALPGQIMRRAHGLYQNPNHLAWFLNAIGLFAISLACLGRGRAWQKVMYVYAGIVCLVGGLLCLSRGGVIALVAGSLCLVVLAITALVVSGSGRRWAVSSLLIAAVVIPATIVIVFASQSVTFQARATQLLSDDYRTRLSLTSLRHLQVAPLFGTGAGTYIDYSRLYRAGSSERDDYQAHNDWFQIAGEYGFVALCLLLFAVLLHMRSGWIGYLSALRTRLAVGSLPQSNSSAVLMGALSGVTMFGVHSLFDFNLQAAPNALLAAAVAGILAAPPQSGGEVRQFTASRVGRYFYVGALGAVSLGLILSLWNSRGEVWTLIAENGLITGNLGSADLSAERALSIQPNNAWTQFVAGGVASANARDLKGADRREEAALSRARFLEATRLSGTERVFHTSLVYMAMVNGEFDLAQNEAVVVVCRDPLRPVGWEQLGMIAQQKGDMSSALRYYGIASSLIGTSIDREKLKVLQDRVRARALEAR